MDTPKLPEWILDEIDIAQEAGLTFSGLDEENRPQYIGTKSQWEKFEDLKLNQ